MRIVSVQVSLQRKVNLGNYESVGFEVALAADLDENDDADECADELLEMARTKIVDRVNQIKATRRANGQSAEYVQMQSAT
jgi:hypothetical protein